MALGHSRLINSAQRYGGKFVVIGSHKLLACVVKAQTAILTRSGFSEFRDSKWVIARNRNSKYV